MSFSKMHSWGSSFYYCWSIHKRTTVLGKLAKGGAKFAFKPKKSARKRIQEIVEISWKSRKSELVKLQYNPNDYKWGTFACPKSYYYINVYPSDHSWTLWHVYCPSWHISWPYWMFSWAVFGGNMDILAQISSYIFIGNMLVVPGNLFGGSGNGYLET